MDFELVKKLMVTTRLHQQIVNRVGVIVIALAVLVTASCIGIMSWLYHKTDAEQVTAELSDRRHLSPSAVLLRTVRATFTAYGSSLR